jgi:hypothetical protein
MSRVLIIYFSEIAESMYESISTELLENGNDVFRININNPRYFKIDYWGGSCSISNNDKLDEILKFDPELVLSFNFSIPTMILNAISKTCKVCIIDADNPQEFFNKKYLLLNTEKFYYLGMQKCSLDLYKRYVSKNIYEGKNYLYFPVATSLKKEQEPIANNISFIGSNFLYLRSPDEMPDGFYEEVGLKLYEQIKKDYFFSFPKALNIINNKFNKEKSLRLFNCIRNLYIGQERLKYLSVLAPLGLNIYGLSYHWRRSAYYDFEIAASFNETPISTIQENQKVYNTSKISVNISHPQAINSFSWRVMDIMASNSCLLMEKKQDWDDLFGQYISEEVKNAIIYKDKIDMYLKAKRLLEDEDFRKRCVFELNNSIEENGRWKHRFAVLEKFISVKLLGDKHTHYKYIKIEKYKINKEDLAKKEHKINNISLNRKRYKTFFYAGYLMFIQIPLIGLFVKENLRNKLYSKIEKYKINKEDLAKKHELK